MTTTHNPTAADEKVLDRIRKLLAMSKDTSSSNEAAIAAARARAMMDKYQVDEMDLTTVSNSDFGDSVYETGITCTMKPIGILAVGVAKFNDCQAHYVTQGKYKNIKFEGMIADSVCASEMMKYLIKEMYRQAELNSEGRGNRHAYRLGFASGVCEQINREMINRQKIRTSDSKGLVVVKQQLVEQHFGAVKYKTSASRFQGSRSAYSSGHAAGMKANLNKSVGGSGRTALN